MTELKNLQNVELQGRSDSLSNPKGSIPKRSCSGRKVMWNLTAMVGKVSLKEE
jgi:hypothetical protein